MRPCTLKQIQTFMEVARQRSVSKTAERLFVTPASPVALRATCNAGSADQDSSNSSMKLCREFLHFCLHKRFRRT